MLTATEMRDTYLQAEQDILLHGVTSRISDRLLTTADLPEIRAGRAEWERRASAEALAAAGKTAGYAVSRHDDE